MNDGISTGDILALTKCNNDGIFGGNGSGLVILLLFLLMGNGGAYNNHVSNVATRQDIDTNSIMNNQNSIVRSINDTQYANANNTANILAGITDVGYKVQNCCCNTQQSIMQLGAESYKNTCEITTAIHSEGEQTRALLKEQYIQKLRDENLQYSIQLSNQAQSANLISQLKPSPIPAYTVSSPYATTNTGCNCIM